MEPFLRRLRARLLRLVFGPVLDPLAEIGLRLDDLGRRLDDLQALLEQVSARGSTAPNSFATRSAFTTTSRTGDGAGFTAIAIIADLPKLLGADR